MLGLFALTAFARNCGNRSKAVFSILPLAFDREQLVKPN